MAVCVNIVRICSVYNIVNNFVSSFVQDLKANGESSSISTMNGSNNNNE